MFLKAEFLKCSTNDLQKLSLIEEQVHDFIVIKCNDISNYAVDFLRSWTHDFTLAK